MRSHHLKIGAFFLVDHSNLQWNIVKNGNVVLENMFHCRTLLCLQSCSHAIFAFKTTVDHYIKSLIILIFLVFVGTKVIVDSTIIMMTYNYLNNIEVPFFLLDDSISQMSLSIDYFGLY